MMNAKVLSEIFWFQKKSQHKAGEGNMDGLYPFFTSSTELSKRIDTFLFNTPGLIFGTGGQASVHYCDKKFSVSTDCFVTQVKNPDEVYLKYVYYYLSGNIRILEEGFKGAGLKHISKEYISQIKIPLPPLEIQKRIAAILDKADELRQNDKKILEKYDQMTQSVFFDMFGDPFKNNKNFKIYSLGELSEKIQIGPFGTQLHKTDYMKGGVPLINPTHIEDHKIVPDFNFTISMEKYLSLPNYHLRKGDIIVGRRGEMGRSAIVTSKEDGWFCGTGSLYIRPNKRVNSVFLSFAISTGAGVRYLENEAKGITMMNLNKTIIYNIRIGLPAIDLQNRFELIVEKIENQKQVSLQSSKK